MGIDFKKIETKGDGKDEGEIKVQFYVNVAVVCASSNDDRHCSFKYSVDRSWQQRNQG